MIHGEAFQQLAQKTGYEDMRSLRFLHYLVLSLKPDSVLEFGTAFGASAAYMASGIGNGLVVSIDNYSGAYAKSPDEVAESLLGLGLKRRVRLLSGSTHDAAAILRDAGMDRKFEVLFMDADHSYRGLKKEFKVASPSLAKEHVVIVDDTHVGGPEIRNFVMELSLQYAFCIMIRDMHWGMAVFCTNSGQAIRVADALGEVSND
jgi:predicted O-methyltransferase YrrM